LGDQLESCAVGDVDGTGLEAFAQCLRHSLRIAVVAHGMNLCMRANAATSGLALLTRSLWQRGSTVRSTRSPYLWRAQAAGRVHPVSRLGRGRRHVKRAVDPALA